MKKRGLVTVGLIFIMSVSSALSVYAGEWKQDTKGWWWQEDNGSYPVNAWKEINGKNYYFGSDGYMLTNTTTPDGYKVGADGDWIQEGNNTVALNNADFYARVNDIVLTDNMVFYMNSKDNYNLWCANLDGTNGRLFLNRGITGSWVEGPDNRLYYIDKNSRLCRINFDGTGDEQLYKKEEANNYVTIRIEFADSTGIQTTDGYYDIATGQFNVGVKKENTHIFSTYDAPESIKAVIPHKDYEIASVRGKAGDYVDVCTYVYNENNHWYTRYDLIGNYIINTKTNTCVAYTKGAKGNPVTPAYTSLQVTDLGLIVKYNQRVEDGGNLVTLFETTSVDSITYYKVKGTSIYYIGNNLEFHVVNNIAPAALPTSKVN